MRREAPDPDQGPTIAQQVDEITSLLSRHGIDHWLDCGTLLGFVRDGRPLPGDKDIDLGVWEDSLAHLLDLRTELRESGFKINTLQYGPWIYGVSLRSVRPGAILGSIGVYRRHGAHAWRMASYIAPNPHRPWSPLFFIRGLFRYPIRKRVMRRRGREDVAALARRWPTRTVLKIATWWIPRHLLEPLAPLPKSGYPAPADPEAYLAAHYGEWRVPVTDYIWWRDDQLVQQKTPEELIAENPISSGPRPDSRSSTSRPV